LHEYNRIKECHLVPEQEMATDIIILPKSRTRLYGWILCCNNDATVYVAGFVLLRHPRGEWFLAKQCIDPEKRKISKTLPVHCTGTL